MNQNNVLNVLITDKLRSTSKYYKYYGNVISVNENKTKGKLLIHIIKSHSPGLSLGSVIETSTYIQPIKGANNIGGFNYKLYLQRLGIFHQIQLNKNNFCQKKDTSKSFLSTLLKFKQRLINALKESEFNEDTKQLLMAMLIGERNELDRVWVDRYVRAGVVHILAISGLHVGLLMLLFGWFFRPALLFKHGHYYQVLLVILCLWIYVALTGFGPSTIRAGVMFSFFSIGKYIKRSPPTLFYLILSFGILVFINPNNLTQVGFQLSYLAVLGILLIQPLLYKLITVKNNYLNWFWKMTTVTLAAQIAVTPLCIYYFNQFPGLFLLSNWVVLPFVSLFLYLGVASFVLIYIKLLPNLVVNLMDGMTLFLNQFVAWVSKQEIFFIQNLYVSKHEILLCYGVLVLLYLGIIRARRVTITTLFVGLVCLQLYSFKAKAESNKSEFIVVNNVYEKTLIIHKKENTANILSSKKARETDRIISDLKKEYTIDSIKYTPLQNSYTFGNKRILIIDSNWMEQLNLNKGEDVIILLTQSAKVNLDFILKHNKISMVIADGSNYPSFREKWSKTCEKWNVKYHDTQKQGAYFLLARNRGI